MNRVRLDIGALTASATDGGSFVFLLYKENMDKSLAVPLSPADTHSILSNFSHPSHTIAKDETIQTLFYSTLNSFRITLLDVEIIRNNEDSNFISQLIFFDGEKRISKTASFIDGVILAKKFLSPIYIMEDLLEKYSTNIRESTNGANEIERSLEILKNQLKQAVDNEDYERAAKINKIIEQIEKNN